ncbi:MAG TPA: MOSC domain-containing protein [Rhodopseudomonas sp.]|uniref:MOSC domain-containing protein n=1 Tax=Rhodopseudomonas sp. TaxID=1078 RepID=UPI002ED9F978
MGRVVAVSLRRGHHFSKTQAMSIRLLAGLGVEGDGHCGVTVKHRHQARQDPTRPNLRQVHLLQAELFDELEAQGFHLQPGAFGENVTTSGVDLLALPTGCLLKLGDSAIVELTGLRNPCVQIDRFQQGLMAATLQRAPDGRLIRKAGVMAIVRAGGDVRPQDRVRIEWPSAPHRPLQPV